MLIELPVAVLQKSPNKDLANQFIQYLKSTPAQELFAQYGFRPVNPPAAKRVHEASRCGPGQFTIDDKTIGGWRAADKKSGSTQPKGLMVKIEQADGGPTTG